MEEPPSVMAMTGVLHRGEGRRSSCLRRLREEGDYHFAESSPNSAPSPGSSGRVPVLGLTHSRGQEEWTKQRGYPTKYVWVTPALLLGSLG